LDYSIIDSLKSNEIEFCKSWSNQTINFNDSFRILANRELKGDYFLNRVILTVGIEDLRLDKKCISTIMSRLKEISIQQNIDVYIHINDNLSFLKSILEQNGLRKIDKLTGLVNIIEGQKFLSKNESKKKNQ
jgi:vacuolar-type H+-ATPase catalytic subunit A/Vma1